MSAVSDLVAAYRRELELPWRPNTSAPERVWMVVYEPDHERRVRANLGEFEIATIDAGYGWQTVDITDAFGDWIATHRYQGAFLADPSKLTSAILEEYEAGVGNRIAEALRDRGVDERTVVMLVGTGSLYPFARASRVLEAVDSDIRGRLAVLFPGRVDENTHNCRLLNARDGFNYRAVTISATRSRP